MADKQKTTEQEEKIRRRAHELWEQEGRPHARHQEHWLRAEQELEMADRNANEGEGNKTAALAFDRNQAEFSQKADVDTKAKAARDALEGREGLELRKAEETAKKHSRGEDPQFHSSSSRRPNKA